MKAYRVKAMLILPFGRRFSIRAKSRAEARRLAEQRVIEELHDDLKIPLGAWRGSRYFILDVEER